MAEYRVSQCDPRSTVQVSRDLQKEKAEPTKQEPTETPLPFPKDLWSKIEWHHRANNFFNPTYVLPGKCITDITDNDIETKLKDLQPRARELGPDSIINETRSMSLCERGRMSEYIKENYLLSPILKLDRYTKIRDKISRKGPDATSASTLAVQISFIPNLNARRGQKIAFVANDGRKYDISVVYEDLRAYEKMPIERVRKAIIPAIELGNAQNKVSDWVYVEKGGRLILLWKGKDSNSSKIYPDTGRPDPVSKNFEREDGSSYTVNFMFMDKDARKKLPEKRFNKICNVLREINKLIPYSEVVMVRFKTDETSSDYDMALHSVTINIEEDLFGNFAHEMGHAVFAKRFGIGQYNSAIEEFVDSRYYVYTKNKEFRSIAFFGNQNDNWEIIDDSNYYKKPSSDYVGHPHSDDSELFASGFSAYYLYADKFHEAIKNEDLPETWRKFGEVMWTFMRDRVWKGTEREVFTSDRRDPFSSVEVADLVLNIVPVETKMILRGGHWIATPLRGSQ